MLDENKTSLASDKSFFFLGLLHILKEKNITFSMNDALKQLIDDFSIFDDWEDRYAYLIDLGKKLPEMPDALKDDKYLVKGCTSRVWLVMSWDEVTCLNIVADSDAHIVRGLVAIVLKVYDGQKARDVINIDMKQAFEQMGLSAHLSPSRRNGFFSMTELINAEASIKCS
jgi:cysteine desulfuration protein SufE